jgi:phosphatidate cytidylyltransferase
MLKQRVITACVLVTVLLVAIAAFPAPWFQAFVAVILCLGAWEWSRLAGLRQPYSRTLYVLLFLPLLYLLLHVTPASRELMLRWSLLWWLLALLLVCRYPRGSTWWHRRALLLPAGLLVLLPGWLALVYLRALGNHVTFILLFIGLVAAADIGAYFAGRFLGRHKLAPAVSPNKTWEGVAGGQVAACLVLWLCLAGLELAGMNLAVAQVSKLTLGTIVLVAFSVIGDLFESMLKRQNGMKDSGTLLPGHGGVLDRLDSITAALPVYAAFLLNAGYA